MSDIPRSLQLMLKINDHCIQEGGQKWQCPKMGGPRLAVSKGMGFHNILYV